MSSRLSPSGDVAAPVKTTGLWLHIGERLLILSSHPGWLLTATLAAWIFTRGLVLAHQGSFPWMNAFVVDVARDILDGDWSRAWERPPLPSILLLPAVVSGADLGQSVTVLYLAASILQFAAFSVLVQQVFARQQAERALAYCLFLLVPLHHSIHHYRNVPVVLSSAAVFLLAAHFIWASRSERASRRPWLSMLWVGGAAAVGGLSRAESSFMLLYLAAAAVVIPEARERRLHLVYALVGAAVFLCLQVGSSVSGADPSYGEQYRMHTFLDSTPTHWLTPECQARLTEDCRVRDAERYFGPEEQAGGLTVILTSRPNLVAIKTLESAAENFEELFLRLSTFPPFLWLVVPVFLTHGSARTRLRPLPRSAWAAAGAALMLSAFPLSWAPAYPQYHLHAVLAVVLILVPIFSAMLRVSGGRTWVVGLFLLLATASGYQYTVYTGY